MINNEIIEKIDDTLNINIKILEKIKKINDIEDRDYNIYIMLCHLNTFIGTILNCKNPEKIIN